jgi:Tol biopolymer transport system component
VRELDLSNHVKQTLPRFTPDGKALAFVAHENDGFVLTFQPLDGGKIYFAPTRSREPIVDFGWSPAGESLAVLSDRSTSDVALLTDSSRGSGSRFAGLPLTLNKTTEIVNRRRK